MKKKGYIFPGALLCVGLALASGCSTSEERLEKEEAYRQIGLNAMEEGDYPAAVEAFNNALDQARGLGANEVDICYYKAAAQFAGGSAQGAIETYDALIEYDKKNPDVWFLRGCVYLKNNESDKAKEDFDNAIKYAEDDEMYLHIYNSLSGAGRGQDAEKYLEEALNKKAGRTARNYTVKGQFYLLKEDLSSAQEQLKKAVDKGDIEGNLYLAQVYERQGKTEEASECINAYVEEYPESSVAYNQKGLEQMEAGNYETALELFGEGLSQQKVTNARELRSNQIAAYEYSGEYEKAKEAMESYLEDYPEDEDAKREYFFLGKNRQDTEQDTEAQQDTAQDSETETETEQGTIQETEGAETGD
ncbi:MAG: tetratricopeptide repeat protein [Roseburia sp.]|nr:tetratricopeptide repeat protein [Roseburia sp.]